MSTHSVSTSLANRRKGWQRVDVTNVIYVSDSEDEYSGDSDTTPHATPNAAQRSPSPEPVQEPPVQEQQPVQEPPRPLALAYHDWWHADHADHSSDDEVAGTVPVDSSTSDDDLDVIKELARSSNKRKADTSIDEDAACAAPVQESPSPKKPRKKATLKSIQDRLKELKVQLEGLKEHQTLADLFTARDLMARLANPHEGSELDMKGITSAFQALKKLNADAKRIDSLKKQIDSLEKQQERLAKRKAKQEATAEERAAKKQKTKQDRALQKEAQDVRAALEMLQLRAGYKMINKKGSLTPKEKAFMDRMMTTFNEPANGQPSEEHFKRNNPNPQNPLTALKSIQDDSNESDWESTDDEAN